MGEWENGKENKCCYFSNFSGMKKFIRFNLWLLLIVAAIILTLAVVQPNDVVVKRSVLINVPKETIITEVANLKNWTKWSALLSTDSTIAITYTGTDGTPSSGLQWKGDEGVSGSGTIKNEGVDGNTMKYSFNVTEPAEMVADGAITVTDTADMVQVTWTFHKHFPFLANAALVLFDLDKYMGADLERSLEQLKKHMEANAPKTIDIKETEYAARIVAGIRDTVMWGDLETFMGDTYSLLATTSPVKITGARTGLFYTWDTVQQNTVVMAGVPVTDTDLPVKGIIFATVPASKAYVATHKGGYAGIRAVHEAMNKQLTAAGQVSWLTVEEYMLYPGNQSDSNKWVTNVYYLIQ